MKKVFAFVAMAVAFVGIANAQLSVNAGYTGKNVHVNDQYTLGSTTYTYDTTMTMGAGFFVGASYNLELMDGLSVAPGLYFSYNGKTDKSHSSLLGYNVDTEVKTTMMDLNIPILLNYKMMLTDDLGIFAFAGPNIQLGLSAKTVTTVTTSGAPIAALNGTATTENNLYAKDNGENQADLTTFDLGVMVGVGAMYQNIRLQVGYNMGMMDRDPYQEQSGEKFTTKFNQFFVGLGYAF